MSLFISKLARSRSVRVTASSENSFPVVHFERHSTLFDHAFQLRCASTHIYIYISLLPPRWMIKQMILRCVGRSLEKVPPLWHESMREYSFF